MKPRVIIENPCLYGVCETDRTKRPVIVVLCGGTAMSNKVVKLTEDEVSRFREYEHALGDLAREIRYGPSCCAGRIVEQSGNEPPEVIDDF